MLGQKELFYNFPGSETFEVSSVSFLAGLKVFQADLNLSGGVSERIKAWKDDCDCDHISSRIISHRCHSEIFVSKWQVRTELLEFVTKLRHSWNLWRLKNTVNLLLAIDLVTVYFELLKVVQNDSTSYFFPTMAQTKEYCAFQVNFICISSLVCLIIWMFTL